MSQPRREPTRKSTNSYKQSQDRSMADEKDQISSKKTPHESLRSGRSGPPVHRVGKQTHFLPIVKETNESKIKNYYDSFMQDHFLYDSSNKFASKKMKLRLQKIQQEIAQTSQSTRVSPIRQSLNGSHKINTSHEIQAEIEKERILSTTKINLNDISTFYMIDKNDFERSTKLGQIETPINENMLDKHKFLLDPQNLKQFSVGIIQKKIQDFRKINTINQYQQMENQLKRQFSESTEQQSQYNEDDDKMSYVEKRKTMMLNPMRTGDITFTELRCIDKMKTMKRWEDAENMGLSRVDSLVESVYNSEKNAVWRNYKPESRDRLLPTEASDEEFDIFDKSDTEDETENIIDDPEFTLVATAENLQEEIKLKKKQEELEKKKQELMINGGKNTPRNKKHFFASSVKNGLTPYNLDKVEIGGMYIASIKEHGPLAVLLKSREQAMRSNKKLKNKYITEIFRFYCNELQIAPVKFLNYFSDGIIQLHNYNIQPNLCIAIASTLPYLIDLEGLKFKNNGIKDEGAALLLKACSLCPKFKIFHFEKNEINDEFVEVLTELMEESSDTIQELSLSSSKNVSKVISKICEALRDDYNLTYLDLSHNNLDAISTKYIGYLVRTTQNLQHLNLSYCAIRGHSARILLNSLLLNQTIKYLNLCWNSFSSSDYEFASKLARIIQVHQNLIHVDITCTQLKREECMFIAQCLKDSNQIVSCHLTGNHVDYYSRIFLRAHLNAIVQFPNKNSTVIQNVVLAHDRAQIVGLNQIIQSNFIIPKMLMPQPQPQQESRGESQFNYVKGSQQLKVGTQHSQKDTSVINISFNLNSETSDSENEENKILPNDLKVYLREDQKRIYDMINMIDVYGRKQKKFEMVEEFNTKFKKSINNIMLDDVNNALRAKLAIEGRDKMNESQQSKKGRIKSEETDFQKALNVIFQAYDDKFLANPMQGFLKDLIFARYLGQDEIDNGHYWRDCNQCWVCEKWDKVKVEFQFSDSIIDAEFQKIQDLLLVQQDNIDNKELNPIWEEHLESLDDEYEAKPQPLDKLDSSKRIIKEFSGSGHLNHETPGLSNKQPRKSNIIESPLVTQEKMQIQTQDVTMSNSNDNEPQIYDQNIVRITKDGAVNLQLEDFKGKTLYNSNIFPIKLNVEKIQKQIIPFNNMNSNDSQVLLNQGCVPYRPFQKIQHQAKETHVIKLPNIYSSNDRSKDDLSSTSPNTGANNSRQPSRDKRQRNISEKQNSTYQISKAQKHDEFLQNARLQSPQLSKKTPRVRTKNEILKMNEELVSSYKNLPDTDDVFLVASFNHWFPVKMVVKAKKKILIMDEQAKKEKVIKDMQNMQKVEMPQSIKRKHEKSKSRLAKLEGGPTREVYRTIEKDEELKYENQKMKVESLFQYTNFLPSGKHFFYFIKKGKYFCLSDKYNITQFKNTNLYMNEIIINKREWIISDVQPRDKDGKGAASKFDKMRSVFRNFREDSEETLRKMFELDFASSKISRIIKNNDDELGLVRELIWNNYNKLRQTFLTLILTSEYPIITWNDFTIFCNKCKVVDKICNLSIIDTIYIATNVSLNNNQNSDRDLSRFEFLEILLRLANEKYKKTGVFNSYAPALQKFLEENLYPNIECTDPWGFRETQLYTTFVNELLVRNDIGLKKLFGLYQHGQKRFINYKDAIDLINVKAELRFLDKQVIRQFGLSKMSHMDVLKDPSFPNRMNYIEFLEFIGRIAFEIFKDHSEMQSEPLHIKYDALLTKLFKIVKFQKQFTYLESNKQNVVYEVVLNPQLALTGGLERQPSNERFDGDRNSDAYSLPSGRVNY
ncbi:UNKNOWN [Stylonychia lemnae]|uniref:Leucine Rich Repeat family protein n=1 Tax=Stylonychia lemnae TaxID=5949 RepID=A0A077ZRR1_STYLE|nr:UNKNOWN [Stylonychia lemnae]|eukprot:CDW72567.1 UNKNOWN [Stylonychia lemnae]